MDRYIQQLVEDLEEVANRKHVAPYFEIPPQCEGNLVSAELVMIPFKPISEWCGIGQECFPPMSQLNNEQCRAVNRAIFMVFDSLGLELVDLPKDIPSQNLYDVLSSNWDHPVQYLPSSGMDFELCTGDVYTCPYKGYCECLDENRFCVNDTYANHNSNSFEDGTNDVLDDDFGLPF